MKKMRLGIIGAGGQRCCFHGGCVFEGVPNAEVAALCDNVPEKLAPPMRCIPRPWAADRPSSKTITR